ncbi:G-type lectin S-receptor-like serine/threonine-protein kinase [Cardamine amara subsp. amara]|uniref:G-type lectin S-receptor-like serine/threonine-protein kinase n=1 Tax=Cardamine amara subsp. amara TaxID=228776 RepID=A0ABD1B351_CARAN
MFLSFQVSDVSSADDTISTNQPLSLSQTIVSSGGIFELGFFHENSAIYGSFYIGMWYRKVSPRTIVWVANPESPIKSAFDCLLKMSNGNLILQNERNKALWSTGLNSSSSKDVQAVLLDNGNLVLRDGPNSSAAVLWQSFDHPSDTWLPGAKLKLGSPLLTSWKSSTDPSPGRFSLEVDSKTHSLITLWNGSNSYWSSGPWDDRLKNFKGLAEGTYLNFILNLDDSYITYSVDPDLIRAYPLVMVLMDVSGQFKLQVWREDFQVWGGDLFSPSENM